MSRASLGRADMGLRGLGMPEASVHQLLHLFGSVFQQCGRGLTSAQNEDLWEVLLEKMPPFGKKLPK